MVARLWKIGERVVDLSQRGMIMGVLNITPDSFSDGGQFFNAGTAIARGIAMAAEGADILDIGGESTRPGAEPVSLDEELKRVIPVIEQLKSKIDIPVSIDTSKAAVAEAAMDAGAAVVNDVTGGRGDEKMIPLVAKRKAGFVIMHMQGEPRTMQVAPSYEDVVKDVGNFFRQQYERALECDVDPMTMAFDPGVGFGKTLHHNLELLRHLEQIRVDGRPLVIGVSRKAFLSKISGTSGLNDRLAPTVGFTAALRMTGGDIFRVHDVKENAAALRAVETLLEN